MTEELPTSWIWTSVGAVVAPSVEQRTPSQEVPFKYIDISSVNRFTKTIETPQHLHNSKIPSRARQIVKTNDVLVSMTRPNLNAVALVHEELDGQVASTGFDVLRAINLDPRWLFYLVRSQTFVDTMSNLVQGALYPAVRPRDIRGFTMPLAPLNEQKRICDKLDVLLPRVDASRKRINSVRSLFKTFRKALLSAATSGKLTESWRQQNQTQTAQPAQLSNNNKQVAPDLTHWDRELPTGWIIASVSQFAECLDSKRIPVKRELRSKLNEAPYPYYGANGLVDKVDDFIFDDELVLVTEDETFYGREKPIAYRVSGKCWVNNHAHVLRAGGSERSDYLCYALSYYDVIPWLTGTTGRAKLTQAVLNSLPIAIPPPNELEVIVKLVKSILLQSEAIEEQITAAEEKIDNLPSAILAKAFKGQLVSQDSNDEPAAELLARIRGATGDVVIRTKSKSPKKEKALVK